MSTAKYTTSGASTLASGINTSATSISVQSGDGAKFPSAGDFWLRLTQASDATAWEIVKATARSTDAITIVRNQAGSGASSPYSFSTNDIVTEVVTAAMLDQIRSDICQTAAFGSRPSPEKDGIIFLPTKGLYAFRDTGGAWGAWGPIMKCTPPPAAASWTAVNQGSSTLTDTNGTVVLFAPNTGGTQLRLYKIAQSNVDFIVEAAFTSSMSTVGNTRSGLAVTDGTKVMTLGPSNDASRSVDMWNSVTSFSSGGTPWGNQSSQINHLIVWRIVYTASGTTFSFEVSTDGGQTWLVLGTNNAFLGTITDVGIFVDSETNGLDVYLNVFHWKVS